MSKLDNIRINLPQDIKDKIKEQADLDERSISNYIRRLLEEYVAVTDEYYKINNVMPRPKDIIKIK